MLRDGYSLYIDGMKFTPSAYFIKSRQNMHVHRCGMGVHGEYLFPALTQMGTVGITVDEYRRNLDAFALTGTTWATFAPDAWKVIRMDYPVVLFADPKVRDGVVNFRWLDWYSWHSTGKTLLWPPPEVPVPAVLSCGYRPISTVPAVGVTLDELKKIAGGPGRVKKVRFTGEGGIVKE